jgi:hypothetical protein
MNISDPIIVLIEAHRDARTATRSACERQRAVEDALGAGVRVPPGDVENNPRWIAANDAVGEALATQDELATKLLETQPRTIAGAAALLTYYLEVIATKQPEVVFPESYSNDRLLESKSINEPRKDFGYFIVRNVAAALSNIADAEGAC